MPERLLGTLSVGESSSGFEPVLGKVECPDVSSKHWLLYGS